MSGYKRYPKYKNSGVDWIGEVPEHWVVGRLRDFTQGISTGPFGTALGQADYVHGGTPVINPSHILESGCIPDAAVTVTEEKAGQLAFWAMQPGDIVTARRGELGRAAIISEGQAGWICGTGSIRIRPNIVKASSSFVHATLQTSYARSWLENQSVGTTMPNLSEKLIGDLPIVVPPNAEEQRTLLRRVLDEQRRLDALIAKKTRFIELLKEKRQALITHAVTKGLDPTAKMKDSGVEWIGAVPEHWDVVQLGKVATSRCDGPFGSGLKSEHYTKSGVRVVRLQNIGSATEFKNADAAFIAHDYWHAELHGGHEVIPGDVLIAGLGDENNPLGRACLAPVGLGDAMVKADCYRFRMGPRVDPEYVALALTATARAECGFLATGATRDRLTLTLASARVIPLPRPDEQREIVGVVNTRSARIDKLIANAARSMALLKERRAALITAAVTGQIDLRDKGETA